MSSSELNNACTEGTYNICVGSWVTGYSAGLWQVVDIFPKYADQDYQTESLHCKKGERIGNWAILKKGFTPKMKFRLGCDYSDAVWLKPVDHEVLEDIQSFFQNNPQKYQQFLDYSVKIAPARVGVWFQIPQNEVEMLEKTLKTLPERFTKAELSSLLNQSGLHCEISNPPGDYHIWLSCFYWELSDEFDQLFFLR